MAIRFEIEYLDPHSKYWVSYPWWFNFFNDGVYYDVNESLQQYNARIIPLVKLESGYQMDLLEFDTEQDAVLFMIRWS